VFSHNTAEVGASVYSADEASETFINCRFTDNVLSGGYETHDLFLRGTGLTTLINCTLANTVGTTEVAYIGGTIRNCIMRGPVVDLAGSVAFSNIQGYSGGTGNIDADPQFVDPAGEDYRLKLVSPCIDTGNAVTDVPDHDLDGNPRPIDIPGRGANGPGQGYDMGCYEYVPPTPVPTPTVAETPQPSPTPTRTPTPIPPVGDLNLDGAVDGLDIFFFARWWDRPENETNFRAEMSGDGHISEPDLLQLIPEWR
jgi:hypothetical protein